MGNFDGNLKMLDPDFVENIQCMITQVIEDIPAKRSLCNKELKVSEVLDYFKTYAKIFEDGKMPEVKTIVATRFSV